MGIFFVRGDTHLYVFFPRILKLEYYMAFLRLYRVSKYLASMQSYVYIKHTIYSFQNELELYSI